MLELIFIKYIIFLFGLPEIKTQTPLFQITVGKINTINSINKEAAYDVVVNVSLISSYQIFVSVICL